MRPTGTIPKKGTIQFIRIFEDGSEEVMGVREYEKPNRRAAIIENWKKKYRGKGVFVIQYSPQTNPLHINPKDGTNVKLYNIKK